MALRQGSACGAPAAHALASDERPLSRGEIDEHKTAFALHQLAMLTGDAHLVEDDIVIAGPPECGHRLRKLDALGCKLSGKKLENGHR